jgi:hypothetical protein
LKATGKPLTITAGERQVTITVEPQAPDPIASVIELDIEGSPKV